MSVELTEDVYVEVLEKTFQQAIANVGLERLAINFFDYFFD